MKPKISHILMISVSVSALFFSNAFADVIGQQKRDNIIDKRLNCFSSHATDQKVDWEDVCVNSKKSDTGSMDENLETKSIDQMIQEHQAMANEFLNNSVIGEEGSSHTIDDVYKKQNQDPDAKRSVDDVIEEQNIYNQEEAGPKDSGSASAQVKVNQGIQVANADYVSKSVKEAEWESDAVNYSSNVSTNSFERDTVKNDSKTEIGFEFNKFRYEEPIFDLVDQGNLFGVYGSYTFRPAKSDNIYEDIVNVYKVEARFNYGTVDYESTSGTIDDITDWTYEIRLLGGKDFLLAQDFRITPYIGFGFRYLNDDSGGKQTSTGAFGYEREAHYFYIPLGVEVTTRINEQWSIVPTVEYDVFIQGSQDSHLSDVPGGYPDLKNKQHQGYGIRGSLRIIKEMKPFSLVVEPYIRYWNIEDSDTVSAVGSAIAVSGLEPANKSTEYGIRLGAMF